MHYKNATQGGGSASRETSSNDEKKERDKPPAGRRKRIRYYSSSDDDNETPPAKHSLQMEKGSVLSLKRSSQPAVKLSDIAEKVAHSLRIDGRR